MEFTYFQAIVTGVVQGITELFPISSLGHAVLLPAWIGGSWSTFTTDPSSSYLSVTVAFHLASAVALFIVFRKRWIGLIAGGLQSIRGVKSEASGVFWRVVIATIPVAIIGKVFEEPLGKIFAKPIFAGLFLTINGVILFTVERVTRRTSAPHPAENSNAEIMQHVTIPVALTIGFGQSLALLSGISRFGITMSSGLLRRLSHASAADFAFLLALPVIAGAAILKVPELFTPEQTHIRGQIVVGSLVSFVCTYASVTFLVRWFRTRTLYPFAIYSLIVGLASVIRFG
ncbi:unannotated protein [freshwater metagenome]|uniref:Undecaprenyl-diphosphatase n=1 Tax=freshwater metagenome TaxID=449393 RepID=A0A6J7XQZ0_9ZZZZ|nr:undecaprenyl-diphosphate phosphatase [Actinomycetota bacterium]